MPIPVALDIPIVEHAEVEIDGVADEAFWAEARVVDSFITFRPQPGNVPNEPTSVRAVASKDAFFVHFKATDSKPGSVYRGYGRRDSRKGDDYVGVLVDVLANGERGALFITNPLGVQLDGTLVRGRDSDLVPWGESWSSWDTRWTSAGRLTDHGYEVEIAIPWSSMRHPIDMDQIGVTFFRKTARTAEMSSWPTLDANIEGTLNQSALANGPGEMRRSLGLSVLPELTATRTNEGAPEDRLGFEGIAPGITLQAAPSPALQVLATLNPDFSQVESDGAKIDVNQRYSLQYQEKRPFFLEGQEWFSHPLKDLVYTRSMVTPLYGGRATSETGPLASSVLHVHDQAPSASVSENGGWTQDDLNGRTADSTVGRLRWSIGADHMVGAVVSNRSIRGTDLHHNLIGLDTRLKLAQKITLQAAALASDTTGIGQEGTLAPAGILRSRIRSRHVQSRVEAMYLSKDFRTENGFQPVADAIRLENRTEIVTYPTWSLIPRLLFSPADGEVTFRESGKLRDFQYSPSIGSWFSNGTYFVIKAGPRGEEYENRWLDYVDGSLMGGGSWTRWLRARMRLTAGQAPYYDADRPFVGNKMAARTSITLQPFTHVALSPTIGWERFQHLDETLYNGVIARLKLELFATPTLWNRWIYDQSTFSGRQSVESLFAWERSPGQAFYLGGRYAVGGMNDSDVVIPGQDPEWALFTKASWVFQR